MQEVQLAGIGGGLEVSGRLPPAVPWDMLLPRHSCPRQGAEQPVPTEPEPCRGGLC